MLRTHELTKHFDGLRAVDQVTIDINREEVAALIGPNGAGKTTFLNMLSGHIRPTSGRVLFEETDVTGLSRHELCVRGIGRNFQQPSFFPSLSVIENVQVPLIRASGAYRDMIRRPSEEVYVEALQVLERVGVEVDASTQAGLLSYGDQRRLEIAIALASQPRILLLDEPTAGMSLGERESVANLITDLNKDGLTILFTEHDMSVVFGVASTIHVLHEGRVIRVGDPETIRTDPTVREVYLGEVSSE